MPAPSGRVPLAPDDAEETLVHLYLTVPAIVAAAGVGVTTVMRRRRTRLWSAPDGSVRTYPARDRDQRARTWPIGDGPDRSCARSTDATRSGVIRYNDGERS